SNNSASWSNFLQELADISNNFASWSAFLRELANISSNFASWSNFLQELADILTNSACYTNPHDNITKLRPQYPAYFMNVYFLDCRYLYFIALIFLHLIECI